MIQNDLFFHRHNPDNSIDSLCLTCFLLVGHATDEGELIVEELSHNCEQAIAMECSLRYEVSQQGTF
jgi:hypothetical protein